MSENNYEDIEIFLKDKINIDNVKLYHIYIIIFIYSIEYL